MKLLQPAMGLLLSLGWVMLSSCGGGGGSPSAGIEGTGSPVVAYGSVTAFGSIYVNGIKFETDNARFIVNGEVVRESAIQPGMVVRIEGVSNVGASNPIAQAVVYDQILLGPVSAIDIVDADTKQLSLLGQNLLIRSDSAFGGTEFDDLSVGDILEISGLNNEEGTLVATRTSLVDATEFEVEGVISDIDSNSTRFKLQDLVVDYSQSSFIDGRLNDLLEGNQVEVRGVLGEEGILRAQVIRFKSSTLAPTVGTLMSLEGVIENFTSIQSFNVGNFAVNASDATVKRGSKNQLAENLRITLQGKIDAMGVLQASAISLHLSGEIKLSGMVENVDLSTNELTVLGTTFTIDSFTAFDDKSNKDNRFINLGEISVGDYVKVYGHYVDEQLIAVRIKRLNDQGTTTISGPVTRIESAALFYVMSIQVDASNAEGNEIIEALKLGTKVVVEGSYTGTKMMEATHIRMASSAP